MNKTKLLSISILSLVIVLGLALASTDTATINSSVTSSTQIDITPNTFTFSGTLAQIIKGNNSAEIENIGSTNISQIAMDASVAGPNPFGSGAATSYLPGDYLIVSTDNTTFYYLHYNSYNETKPVYLDTSAISGGPTSQGRIRFGSSEFFWAAKANAQNSCANGTLYITNTTAGIHNISQIGDVVLGGTSRSLTNTSVANVSTVTSYGLANVQFAHNIPNLGGNYCVAVNNDCTELSLFSFNNNQDPYDNVSACSNDAYFYNNADAFKPGSIMRLYLGLIMPYGTANGTMTASTLTVRATD